MAIPPNPAEPRKFAPTHPQKLVNARFPHRAWPQNAAQDAAQNRAQPFSAEPDSKGSVRKGLDELLVDQPLFQPMAGIKQDAVAHLRL